MNPTEVRWPDSLWAAVTPQGPALPQLEGSAEADVVIIGAGFTGLSAALHLREAGIDVAVIEAAEPGWGASGRNNGQVIPTLSRPDPDDIVARHGAAGERFVAMLRDSANALFDLARRYQIQAEQEQTGWIQPVHSPGRIRIAERRVRQWSARGAPVELLSREQMKADARLGGLVWRLLESQRRPRQSAGAGARHGACGARSRRPHLCALAGTNVSNGAAIAGWSRRAAAKSRAARLIVATNAYTGEFSKSLLPAVAHEVIPIYSWQMATEPLSEAARKTIIPGRQAMSDTHGELYFARYDARNRLVTGGALISAYDGACAPEARRRRAAAAAVAADRRREIRLCLERLCRHDHRLPAAHPSPRPRRLCLDRLQRPRGGPVDSARRGTGAGGAGLSRSSSWRCPSRRLRR